MLSSITPLGQRGRGSSWVRTVVAFWIGALLAAVVVFGAVGVLGETSGLTQLHWSVSIAVVAVAMILDLLRVKPVGPRRQVNEDWLPQYRDWVTGFGFGFQLGAGLTTIIPVWAVWSLFALAALSGLPIAILIGLAFAAGRSIPLFAAGRVDRPERLAALMSRLAGLDRPAMRALFGAYAMVLVIGVLYAG